MSRHRGQARSRCGRTAGPVDFTVDEVGLDPTHVANRNDAEANLADLIDQAISVPLTDDDHPGAVNMDGFGDIGQPNVLDGTAQQHGWWSARSCGAGQVVAELGKVFAHGTFEPPGVGC
ncbi:MAG: hypothetical protein QOH20_4828 [Mycobacterium sp.]|jgi:hypothetical protein|nr:hypothetical protein [Mycobacterium sp.]